ncbi:MAG: 7-carboxy-7-deazaguanine synthase QueE [Phycisphaerales bacterium]
MTAPPTTPAATSPHRRLTVSPSHPTLPISETFSSLQGEGLLTGVPSFFIRVSGCNLRCAWCDTPYASWEPDGGTRPIDALVAEARASGLRHAVLTGGEPMIFDQLPALAAALRAAGLHITIETAGTVFRAPPVPCDLMSISPKLSSSTPGVGRLSEPIQEDPRDPTGAWRKRHEQRRLNIPALRQLIEAHPAPTRQLKFVITPAVPESDLAEIDALLAQLRPAWTDADILLMPEGVTTPDPAFRRWLAAECLRRNWRYCPRLHIELFGNTRGT